VPIRAGKAIDLDFMFKSHSIAIIGVSNDANKLSGRPLKFLLEYGYQGNIYPINPKYEQVQGLKSYADLDSVPGDIDLAIISLPAASVSDAVRTCAKRGVKAAVIFSAGFAEIGDKGEKLQAELRAAAAEGDGVAICGPNCAGLMGIPQRVIASFNSALDRGIPKAGDAAFVAQSGALGTYMFAAAQDAGVGFDYWVSTGNEVNLGFADYVLYFINDKNVQTVMTYMEDARDGEALRTCAREAARLRKPIIVLKVGTSEAGAQAASSHTGALAGSDKVYSAFFKQEGIIRAHTVEELFDYGSICTSRKRPNGNGTALMTISGGAGILMADNCEENGLRMPEPSLYSQERLAHILPPFGSAKNPIDLTAELVSRPDMLREAAEVILADDNFQSLIIFVGLQIHTAKKLANDIVKLAGNTAKLVVVNWMAIPQDALQILRQNNIPVFTDPTRGVKAVAAIVNYTEFINKQQNRLSVQIKEFDATISEDVQGRLGAIRSSGRKTLTEIEGKQILQAYGIEVAKGEIATSAHNAAEIAEKIGFPVVMKVVSQDIAHKTEAGGVKLRINSPAEAEEAYLEIMDSCQKYSANASIAGILVEEMVVGGVETIIGGKTDNRLGPAITFGLGGIFVELLKDFSLRLAPINTEESEDMIKEIKGFKMLAGYRGESPKDIEVLVQTLTKLSAMFVDLQEYIAEFDINPLVAMDEGRGVKVLDALIILK